MDLTSQFIAEIDAFLQRSGMTASYFGKAAINDPNFVGDLKNEGRQPTLKVVGRVKQFIQSQDEDAGAAA